MSGAPGPAGAVPGAHQMAWDADRPRFHLQPARGFNNDPNGPLFYKGRYHMFYQHLPNACAWDFGIVWGHAVSTDLVHWEHLPPALVPTPGWVDHDGCFSGCCVIDFDGHPVILYTGVRLRSNPACGPLPPPEHDLGLVWVESQCAAVPEDPDDDLLIRWRKLEAPFLPLPPADLMLTGWRDPFIYRTHASSLEENGFMEEWRMLIGAGIKGKGGTALVYRSQSLFEGWELVGQLCTGSSLDTGFMWECPIVVPLEPVQQQLAAPLPRQPPRWLIDRGGGAAAATQQQVAGWLPLGGLSAALAGGLWKQPSVGSQGAGGLWKQPSGGSAFANSSPGRSPPTSPPSLPPSPFHAPATSPEACVPRLELDDLGLGAGGASSSGEAGSGVAAAGAAGEEGDGGEGALEMLERAPSFEFSIGESSLLPSGVVSPDAASTPVASPLRPAIASPPPASGTAPGMPGAGLLGDGPGMRGLSRGAAAAIRRAPSPIMEGAFTLEGWHSGGESEEEAAKDGPSAQQPQQAADLMTSQISFEFAPEPSSLDAASGASGTGGGGGVGAGGPGSAQRPAVWTADGPGPAEPGIPHGSDSNEDEDEERRSGAGPGSPDSGFDTVVAALSRVPRIKPKAPLRSSVSSLKRLTGWNSQTSLSQVQQPVAPWGLGSKAASPMAQRERQQWHLFTVSPDAPTNPVLYWVGQVDESGLEFKLEDAKGPFRLDLGDILYAPNVLQDEQGRWLLWGWLQERRKVGSYDYSGCMTLPRMLHVTPEGRLIQAPVPELRALRTGHAWQAQQLPLLPNVLTPIPAVAGQHLDIECSIERGNASAVGLLFRSWQAEAEGGTAVVYDWDRGVLEAIFNVPPSFGANTGVAGAACSGVEAEEGLVGVDLAELLTPRGRRVGAVAGSVSVVGGPGGLSRSTSYQSLRGSPIMRLSSLGVASSLSGGDFARPPSLSRGGLLSPRAPATPRTPGGGLGSAEADEDLEFLLEELSEPMRRAPAEPQELRRVGGPLSMHPSEPLHLRVFVDRSCVEVYTGSGEVLSTRIYRGEPPPGADSGIEFVTFGGVATLVRTEAHEMASAYEAAPPPEALRTEAAAIAAYAAGSGAGSSAWPSPRHVLHPAGAGGLAAAGAGGGGISEEEFRAAVAAALAEGAAGGSRGASPRERLDELVYCISPHAAAY